MMTELPEGHLPAQESVEFFLGLAFNAAARAKLSERMLERALGVELGTIAAIEAGIRPLDQPLVGLTWVFHNQPEFARHYARTK